MSDQAMPPAKPNQWSTGLCDCCGTPGGCLRCCKGSFCPCCLIGENFERLPRSVICGGNFMGACCLYCCATYCLGFTFLPQMMSRAFLRQKYGIPGNEIGDLCVTCCCSACYACQEARELDIREGFRKPVTDYTPGGGQTAAPPPPPAQMNSQAAAAAAAAAAATYPGAPYPPPHAPPPVAGYPVHPPPPGAYPPPPHGAYPPPPQPVYYPAVPTMAGGHMGPPGSAPPPPLPEATKP